MTFDYLKTINGTGYLFNATINEMSVSCGVATFRLPAKTPIKLYDRFDNHVISVKSLPEIERCKTGITLVDKTDQLLFEII